MVLTPAVIAFARVVHDRYGSRNKIPGCWYVKVRFRSIEYLELKRTQRDQRLTEPELNFSAIRGEDYEDVWALLKHSCGVKPWCPRARTLFNKDLCAVKGRFKKSSNKYPINITSAISSDPSH